MSKENLTLDVECSGTPVSETTARVRFPVLRFLGIWSCGESLLRPRPRCGSPSWLVMSVSAPFIAVGQRLRPCKSPCHRCRLSRCASGSVSVQLTVFLVSTMSTFHN